MQEYTIHQMAEIMASKVFDSDKISQTPFLEWDGRSEIDCQEIEKLFYSYNFAEMADKPLTVAGKLRINKQIDLFQRFKKKERLTGRVLISLLFFFAAMLFLFINGIVGSLYFYSSVVILYLFSINYPVVIRKKVRRYRYITLH